jgi:predicted kinase
MTSLSVHAAIIEWTCEACHRHGVAVVLHNDPKSPDERALASHQAVQPNLTRHRCRRPSITWRRRAALH